MLCTAQHGGFYLGKRAKEGALMRKLLFILVCVMTAGCATTARYEAQLDSWIGSSEESLVAGWGVPDKEYRLNDGKKAVEYIQRDTIQTGGYAYTRPQTTYETGTIGDEPYSSTSTTYVKEVEPVKKYKLYCSTSFIIGTDGKVVSWQHEGNNCVAH